MDIKEIIAEMFLKDYQAICGWSKTLWRRMRWINSDGENGAVSEPATMILLGLGLIGLAGYGRGKFKQ
jgi:hypothetical protein